MKNEKTTAVLEGAQVAPGAPAAATPPEKSIAAENRKRLQALYVKGGYSSVKFWVSPNALTSEDECIAEVADALETFQNDKAKGKLKPVGEDFTC